MVMSELNRNEHPATVQIFPIYKVVLQVLWTPERKSSLCAGSRPLYKHHFFLLLSSNHCALPVHKYFIQKVILLYPVRHSKASEQQTGRGKQFNRGQHLPVDLKRRSLLPGEIRKANDCRTMGETSEPWQSDGLSPKYS